MSEATIRGKTTPESTPGSFAPHARSESEVELTTPAAPELGVKCFATAGPVRVTYSYAGDGMDEEYDPSDPDDVPLLRVSIDLAETALPEHYRAGAVDGWVHAMSEATGNPVHSNMDHVSGAAGQHAGLLARRLRDRDPSDYLDEAVRYVDRLRVPDPLIVASIRPTTVLLDEASALVSKVTAGVEGDAADRVREDAHWVRSELTSRRSANRKAATFLDEEVEVHVIAGAEDHEMTAAIGRLNHVIAELDRA